LAENPLATRRAVDRARQQIPVGVRAEDAPSSLAMGRSFRRYKAEVSQEFEHKEYNNFGFVGA
jgi:hypothetical protein